MLLKIKVLILHIETFSRMLFIGDMPKTQSPRKAKDKKWKKIHQDSYTMETSISNEINFKVKEVLLGIK